MITDLHWQAIAIRLILTIVSGALLGTERSKSGHAAGLRTTLLVALAASVSMIQMNLLIPTNGKPHDSYAVMDLMRLPLGILTGVGFIGAGAIIKKGELVLGLTTAATMWFATVVGLCMGGGQLILGSTSTLIGFAVLWGLRFGERHLERQQQGTLIVVSEGRDITPRSLTRVIEAAHMRVKSASAKYESEDQRKFCFELKWERDKPTDFPDIVEQLQRLPGVASCEWNTTGDSGG